MAISVLKRKDLGETLIARGLITGEQLDACVLKQQETKDSLGNILLKNNYVSKENLLSAMSYCLGVPFLRGNDVKVERNILALMSEKTARRFMILPLSVMDGVLNVAMADPSNVIVKDEIEKILNMKISVSLMDETEIKEAIERYYVRTSLGDDDIGTTPDVSVKDEGLNDDLGDAEAAPVIRYVNSIFFDAAVKKASDIHLEAFEKDVALRMRIDGALKEFPAPQKKYYNAIISRIKIMSDLDIAERRLPQDGKCKIKVNGNKIDVRVSLVPTIYGEKAVLRMLNKGAVSLDVEKIGMSESELKMFKEAISMPYGMILVTGPTSSGKTTTLYAALQYLNTPDLNILTAEDPVEYELKNINQVQIRADIGLTFANVLRTFMRQDPDVILVGEIRDQETAGIAIQAALTGHMVFSTLHTNDSVSTLSRMTFMGIEKYLVADSVNLVMAQRLVRKICPDCKKELTDVPDNVYKSLGLTKDVPIYQGAGCEKCGGSGYKGRTAIFEILGMSREIKELIVSDATDLQIRDKALEQGFVTLRGAAINKLKEGVTTIEEVLSVTIAG
ncbi:MAG: Flp pilus assembly complex ATPase component TadA [Endomicrobia bacterium]|nr:Flp pilus assembly complex ATPase component TadA [Endomicrobiia bacterium]MCL2799575.1 Flp pilus assembly complex ATPase component TadA [Endomicrobiia bacterium]